MNGKKQYGYLPKCVKKQADEIVDQMARLSPVQKCYEKWLELQQEVNEFYSDKQMDHTPLSQQKEFRAIHNAVIQAALQVNRLTFEDQDLAGHDEPDDSFQTDDGCRRLWTVTCDGTLPLELRDKGIERFHTQAEGGNPYAQFLLGGLYRDGPLVTPDWVEAQHWFEQAAQSLPDAQYALGKLLLTDNVEVHNREQGIQWLMQSAEGGNAYAAYRLGKELLNTGNTAEALPWLTMSAEADNPYAEYLLGKLYWESEDIPQDMEQALYWLTQAAEQGLIPANPADEVEPPKVIRQPMNILSADQLDTFTDTIKADSTWYDFFYTELTTSLRLGKICGLMWTDFDSRAGVLHICRTLHRERAADWWLETPKLMLEREKSSCLPAQQSCWQYEKSIFLPLYLPQSASSGGSRESRLRLPPVKEVAGPG